MSESKYPSLEEIINQGAAFEVENLVNRQEWGSINFENAREDLQQAVGIFAHFSTLPIENLTTQAASQVESSMVQVINQIEAIDSFSIDTAGNVTDTRDTLVSNLHSHVEQLITTTAPWMPFLAYLKGDIQENITKLTDAVGEAQQLIEDSKTELEKKQNAVDDIVTKTREAAGKAGAAVFTKEFSDEAKDNKNSAKPWLIAAGFFATLTAIVAGALWYFAETPKEGTELQLLTTKFIILGLLFAITVWCGKMYKTLMHLSVVNKQKALGLQTFQAFSAAADDPTTKDAVLLETTKSIFSVQNTGLVGGSDSSSTEGVTKVIETVKTVADDTK